MAMKRELQVKELKVMDATRRDFLHHQQRVKEARIQRLDDQIKKRVSPIGIASPTIRNSSRSAVMTL